MDGPRAPGPGRLSQKLIEAVAAAGDYWASRLGEARFEADVRECVDDLGLTSEELTRALSAWPTWDRSERPARREVLWRKSASRAWMKRAAGLGDGKPARKSGALPMSGGGGKAKPRRVRAFENKATYDARIARESVAS